ncbi:hypothetical protein LPJ56_004428 [Coemansia sp. RSA 2599]|nr:hypothetical protein LPJ56_004428 [Coemansia sp. RSA 2599]
MPRHMAKNDEIVSLHPCNHKFHVECAFDWFTQKSVNCPDCGQDMIKSLGLPEPMYYGRQDADTTSAPAYQMPDPNQYGTNNSNGNYPMAPNQAHVTDKQNPFL